MNKLLIGLVFLAGCASQGVDREDQNRMIKRFYAKVNSIQPVQLSSDVKTAVAAGSAIGFVDQLDGNHEEMIAGAIAGGLIAGLVTAISEGSHDAFEYSLSSQFEGDFKVIEKQKVNIESGCVAVTIASEVKITATAANHCQF